MFNSEIEKKIINFIKKSPLGVTSSELARYLGISRITLTKYLAIIKEKTLIDFKQLGMAKLWYVPVNINKELFLKKTIYYLVSNSDKNEIKKLLEKTGLELGKYIEQVYKDFYKVEKFNLDQLTETLVDSGKKIGGGFKLVEKSDEKIVLRYIKNPFDEKDENSFILISNIFGGITFRNFAYSKVVLSKAETDKEKEDLITIFLKKTEESDKEGGLEFHG